MSRGRLGPFDDGERAVLKRFEQTLGGGAVGCALRLAGLYAGNPKRDTDRPTAERLLEAFQDITLIIIQEAQQTTRHVTALSPLQQRILEMLGFSSALYTKLCTVSSEPP